MPRDEHAAYVLPSLGADRGSDHWRTSRRRQLLDTFAANVYGWTPEGGAIGDITVVNRIDGALDSLATITDYDLTLTGPRGLRTVAVLLFVPAAASATSPAPALLGLNFWGNHTMTTESEVRVSSGAIYTPTFDRPVPPWDPSDPPAITGHQALPHHERGSEADIFVPAALARGYAVATLHFPEIEVDRPDAGAAVAGVRGLFTSEDALEQKDPEAWGALGAWAWSLSRVLDMLEILPEIDHTNVFAHGISRYGKVALWAAAQDERFAGVLPGVSGCGGAALFRNKGGENVAAITHLFPNWFAPRLATYSGAEDRLPIDQHQLLALIAPRALHVASATRDSWADPRNEHLSTVYASPVYELFGEAGTLPAGTVGQGGDVPDSVARATAMPPVDTRIGGRLSYSLRDGEHGGTSEDWTHFLAAADDAVGRHHRS